MKTLIRNTILLAVAVATVGIASDAQAQLLRRGNGQGVIRQGVRSFVQQNGASIVHGVLNQVIPTPGQYQPPGQYPPPGYNPPNYNPPGHQPPIAIPNPPVTLPGPALPGVGPAIPGKIVGGINDAIGIIRNPIQTPKLPGPPAPYFPSPSLPKVDLTKPVLGVNPFGAGRRVQEAANGATRKMTQGVMQSVFGNR